MSKEYIATADTIEDAKAEALAELGIDESDATIEILEEPGKKLFGSRKSAVVKVSTSTAKNAPDDDSQGSETNAKTDTKDAADQKEAEKASSKESNGLLSIEDLNDEQIDEIADVGIEYLTKLASYLSDSEIKIEEFEGDEGEIILDVTGEDVAVLIGRHGRTIDALQSVVSSMTTKKTGVRYPLAVDVEGYKHRRKQKVVEIARRAADRAKRTDRRVALKSMPAHERRIVHMTLKNHGSVTSASEGSGSHRYVVILPK